MPRDRLSSHAVRLGLVLALGAVPAGLAGCDRSNCAGCTDAVPVIFRGARAQRVEDLFVAGDWVVQEVTDINDRGQIVGWGTHRATGVRGALLLTPPAP